MELTKSDKPPADSAASASSPAAHGLSMLLDLRPQIRHMIYKVIIDSEDRSYYGYLPWAKRGPATLLSLAQTCKLLRQECLPMYEEYISYHVDLTELDEWLERIFEPARTACVPILKRTIINNNSLSNSVDVTNAVLYLAGLFNVDTAVWLLDCPKPIATIIYNGADLEKLKDFVDSMAASPGLLTFIKSHARVEVVRKGRHYRAAKIVILVNRDVAEPWMQSKDVADRDGLVPLSYLVDVFAWNKKMGTSGPLETMVFLDS